VLDAIAGEDAMGLVVHLHREVAGELALDLAQHLAQPRLELDDLGRGVELRLGSPPLISLDDRVQLGGAHRATKMQGGTPPFAAAGQSPICRTPLHSSASTTGCSSA